MRKILYGLLIFLLVAIVSCSKEKDGRQAEEEALESFFKPYGDTCFVEHEGVYLYFTVEGQEEFKDGDSLTLIYSGRTLENVKNFQDSIRIIYPDGDMVEGWVIAQKYLKKKSEGILVVPYKKGYGKRRVGTIEPFSTLVYTFRAK